MSTINTCPKCDSPLPQAAPAGLCPKCLLGAGVAGTADAGDLSQWLESSMAARPMTPPAPEALAPLFPQLEILELIGFGGMGAVYKARQRQLDRVVALKIVRPDTANDPDFTARFLREARVLAQLDHENIVGIYDYGEVELSDESAEGPADGTLFYFLMEYVDGADLRQLLKAKTLSPSQALQIIPQICEALQYAHDEGFVHRDIKPENVLLDQRGRVKIADFGLAKLVSPTGYYEATLTGAQQVMGTPRYMAPEQLEGSLNVDHRADIYSLGVVFYELLTGELPIGHFDPPSRKAEVNAQLDDVVLRALAKEPRRRYQSASQVRNAVDSVSQLPPPVVTPTPEVNVKPAAQTPKKQASSLLTAVLIGIGVMGAMGLVSLIGLVVLGMLVAVGRTTAVPMTATLSWVAVSPMVSVDDPQNVGHFYPHGKLSAATCGRFDEKLESRLNESMGGFVELLAPGDALSVSNSRARQAGRARGCDYVVRTTIHCVDENDNIVAKTPTARKARSGLSAARSRTLKTANSSHLPASSASGRRKMRWRLTHSSTGSRKASPDRFASRLAAATVRSPSTRNSRVTC